MEASEAQFLKALQIGFWTQAAVRQGLCFLYAKQVASCNYSTLNYRKIAAARLIDN